MRCAPTAARVCFFAARPRFDLPDDARPRIRVKATAYENRMAELRYWYHQAETDAQRAALLATLERVTMNYTRAYPDRPMGAGEYTPPAAPKARKAPQSTPHQKPRKAARIAA